MKRDFRNPSEVFDAHWIYMYSDINNYEIQKGDSGKWLIFEHVSKIDELWAKVREATINGQFGECSKVSTAKPNRNASDSNFKVICIYTADFSNKEDVERIEKSIRGLGIENKLIYKLDKDAGKYHNQGHRKLSQQISYSKKYYDTLTWLNENNNNKYINFQGENRRGKKRFRFQRLDIPKEEFELKKQTFNRIGFYIENQKEINEEDFFFSE